MKDAGVDPFNFGADGTYCFTEAGFGLVHVACLGDSLRPDKEELPLKPSPKSLRVLLEAGGNPNAVQHRFLTLNTGQGGNKWSEGDDDDGLYGTTPLMLLCEGSDQAAGVECINLLIAHGANPFIKNKEGKKASELNWGYEPIPYEEGEDDVPTTWAVPLLKAAEAAYLKKASETLNGKQISFSFSTGKAGPTKTTWRLDKLKRLISQIESLSGCKGVYAINDEVAQKETGIKWKTQWGGAAERSAIGVMVGYDAPEYKASEACQWEKQTLKECHEENGLKILKLPDHNFRDIDEVGLILLLSRYLAGGDVTHFA